MCVEHFISHKKEWNLATCNDIDGPRDIIPSEISQRNTVQFYLHMEPRKQNRWTNRIESQKQQQKGAC